MDELLLFADTEEEVTRYNIIILRTCEQHGITVNWKKSEPHKEVILFCGFEISKDGTRIDPDKYSMFQDYP
jgi:hypothetical protein